KVLSNKLPNVVNALPDNKPTTPENEVKHFEAEQKVEPENVNPSFTSSTKLKKPAEIIPPIPPTHENYVRYVEAHKENNQTITFDSSIIQNIAIEVVYETSTINNFSEVVREVDKQMPPHTPTGNPTIYAMYEDGNDDGPPEYNNQQNNLAERITELEKRLDQTITELAAAKEITRVQKKYQFIFPQIQARAEE
ncbi:16975_t:CDS:2, partial [Gigaspora rosea]